MEDEMSDRAIRHELRRLKIPHGPITDTTRRTYLLAIERAKQNAVSPVAKTIPIVVDGNVPRGEVKSKSRRQTSIAQPPAERVVPGLANTIKREADRKQQAKRRTTIASPVVAAGPTPSSRSDWTRLDGAQQQTSSRASRTAADFSFRDREPIPVTEYKYVEAIETIEHQDDPASVFGTIPFGSEKLSPTSSPFHSGRVTGMAGALRSRSSINRPADHYSKATWSSPVLQRRFGKWKLTAQSSQPVLIGILVILFVLATLYLIMSNQRYLHAVCTSTASALLDTLVFVYKRMLLPLITLSFVVLMAGMVVLYKRNAWRRAAENRRQVYQLAETITDFLKNHHEECVQRGIDSSLPVPHVRDQLIPLYEREAMAPVWKRAVDFLSENESRIRTMTKCIGGEEFQLWQWMEVTTPANKWRGDVVDRLTPSPVSSDVSRFYAYSGGSRREQRSNPSTSRYDDRGW